MDVEPRYADRGKLRQVRVPDVQLGIYRVVTFVFYEDGYGWFGGHRFHVTP
jgi:hypothetical protein